MLEANDTTKHDTYNCICGKIYEHEKGLKRHKQTCQNKKKLAQTKYCFKDCTQSFFHQTALLHHLEKSHGFKPKKKNTFNSVDAFQKWKENEETTKFTYFSIQSGKKYTNKTTFSIMSVNMMVLRKYTENKVK